MNPVENKQKVSITVEKIVIPTYPEPGAEEMPMFAENRVHQRSTGRPYPNKVVLKVERNRKIDKEYTLVRLENEYVCVEILPEIGGRIYSARDKVTGYDFFYKQHVIKPALIGVLGSWVSGGVEFNWPFHHRASGFMPCDFTTEELADGSAICWISEHDPIDRMRGTVGIVLKPGCSWFETRMKVYNRTQVRHSFLWWENAAVPVNEEYRIFFPPDVKYVNFHYLKSRISYPIAGNNVFNGIPMMEDRDISWHKNTKQATSYFASASDFDFFGGYDYGKQCGVVHIGDRYVTPGKKMFTWAYCQLAKSWENALTDTDGAYAELMAGSYSDNQPNFSWLAPYETKQFSQYWYPISQIGSPVYANLKCAFSLEREEKGAVLKVQTTERFANAVVAVYEGERELFAEQADLVPENAVTYLLGNVPEHVTVKITCAGKTVGEYTEKEYDQYTMPEPINDTPQACNIEKVQELYLAGVHVDQYRDPAVNPDAYWKEALKREPGHIPSLIAMAEYEYKNFKLEEALEYIEKAISLLFVYNERPESGKAYYVRGLIQERMGSYQAAYASYQKAAWAADSVAAAMTRVAVLDLRNGEPEQAYRHALQALEYGCSNSLAVAVAVLAGRMLGDEEAESLLSRQLDRYPLDQMARYLSGAEDFYENLSSSPSQTCLDLAEELAAMGQYEECIVLLKNLLEKRPEERYKPVWYALGYYTGLTNKPDAQEQKAFCYASAARATLGSTFPFRYDELLSLQDAVANKENDSSDALVLLGDLLYHKLHYSRAATLWQQAIEQIEKGQQDSLENQAKAALAGALRNLAIAYFSHLNREREALTLMEKALAVCPDEEQLLYETAVLMDKLGVEPAKKLELLSGQATTRDDILVELAKAYNQSFQPDEALKVLMSHDFVPCEGGEHAIADQYMFAYLIKGLTAYKAGNVQEAQEFFAKGQVLPQSLGAGIWNHCKLIPLKYHQALCMKARGDYKAAEEIWEYIAGTKVEYFSNMHLKELPFYQAMSLMLLDRKTEAVQIITKYLREWDKIKDVKDSGYFGTTPFFISFMDDPAKLRKAQHLYLTGLCCVAKGDRAEFEKRMKASAALNNENLFALAAANGFLWS